MKSISPCDVMNLMKFEASLITPGISNTFRHVVGSRRQVQQHLRIIQENINVFAMSVREHLMQHCSAAHAPCDPMTHRSFGVIDHVHRKLE